MNRAGPACSPRKKGESATGNSNKTLNNSPAKKKAPTATSVPKLGRRKQVLQPKADPDAATISSKSPSVNKDSSAIKSEQRQLSELIRGHFHYEGSSSEQDDLVRRSPRFKADLSTTSQDNSGAGSEIKGSVISVNGDTVSPRKLQDLATAFQVRITKIASPGKASLAERETGCPNKKTEGEKKRSASRSPSAKRQKKKCKKVDNNSKVYNNTSRQIKKPRGSSKSGKKPEQKQKEKNTDCDISSSEPVSTTEETADTNDKLKKKPIVLLRRLKQYQFSSPKKDDSTEIQAEESITVIETKEENQDTVEEDQDTLIERVKRKLSFDDGDHLVEERVKSDLANVDSHSELTSEVQLQDEAPHTQNAEPSSDTAQNCEVVLENKDIHCDTESHITAVQDTSCELPDAIEPSATQEPISAQDTAQEADTAAITMSEEMVKKDLAVSQKETPGRSPSPAVGSTDDASKPLRFHDSQMPMNADKIEMKLDEVPEGDINGTDKDVENVPLTSQGADDYCLPLVTDRDSTVTNEESRVPVPSCHLPDSVENCGVESEGTNDASMSATIPASEEPAQEVSKQVEDAEQNSTRDSHCNHPLPEPTELPKPVVKERTNRRKAKCPAKIPRQELMLEHHDAPFELDDHEGHIPMDEDEEERQFMMEMGEEDMNDADHWMEDAVEEVRSRKGRRKATTPRPNRQAASPGRHDVAYVSLNEANPPMRHLLNHEDEASDVQANPTNQYQAYLRELLPPMANSGSQGPTSPPPQGGGMPRQLAMYPMHSTRMPRQDEESAGEEERSSLPPFARRVGEDDSLPPNFMDNRMVRQHEMGEQQSPEDGQHSRYRREFHRVPYSKWVLTMLEHAYQEGMGYVRSTKKFELSMATGLSSRQIKVWFQNRRAKDRKLKKRGKLPFKPSFNRGRRSHEEENESGDGADAADFDVKSEDAPVYRKPVIDSDGDAADRSHKMQMHAPMVTPATHSQASVAPVHVPAASSSSESKHPEPLNLVRRSSDSRTDTVRARLKAMMQEKSDPTPPQQSEDRRDDPNNNAPLNLVVAKSQPEQTPATSASSTRSSPPTAAQQQQMDQVRAAMMGAAGAAQSPFIPVPGAFFVPMIDPGFVFYGQLGSHIRWHNPPGVQRAADMGQIRPNLAAAGPSGMMAQGAKLPSASPGQPPLPPPDEVKAAQAKRHLLLPGYGYKDMRSTHERIRTPNRYRTPYTDEQTQALEHEYRAHGGFISITRKEELSKSLCLSYRQIKIWFQNRRAKERRQHKRAAKDGLPYGMGSPPRTDGTSSNDGQGDSINDMTRSLTSDTDVDRRVMEDFRDDDDYDDDDDDDMMDRSREWESGPDTSQDSMQEQYAPQPLTVQESVAPEAEQVAEPAIPTTESVAASSEEKQEVNVSQTEEEAVPSAKPEEPAAAAKDDDEAMFYDVDSDHALQIVEEPEEEEQKTETVSAPKVDEQDNRNVNPDMTAVVPQPPEVFFQHLELMRRQRVDSNRSQYSREQIKTLEAEFNVHAGFISSKRRSELSESLGLTTHQIKVWFQNRRAKERRHMQKYGEGDPIALSFLTPGMMGKVPMVPLSPNRQAGGHPRLHGTPTSLGNVGKAGQKDGYNNIVRAAISPVEATKPGDIKLGSQNHGVVVKEEPEESRDSYSSPLGLEEPHNSWLTRKTRTKFSEEQILVLETAFANNQFPTGWVKAQLSQVTGLTMRQIHVWFMNRRQKEKHSRKRAGRATTSPGGRGMTPSQSRRVHWKQLAKALTPAQIRENQERQAAAGVPSQALPTTSVVNPAPVSTAAQFTASPVHLSAPAATPPTRRQTPDTLKSLQQAKLADGGASDASPADQGPMDLTKKESPRDDKSDVADVVDLSGSPVPFIFKDDKKYILICDALRLLSTSHLQLMTESLRALDVYIQRCSDLDVTKFRVLHGEVQHTAECFSIVNLDQFSSHLPQLRYIMKQHRNAQPPETEADGERRCYLRAAWGGKDAEEAKEKPRKERQRHVSPTTGALPPSSIMSATPQLHQSHPIVIPPGLPGAYPFGLPQPGMGLPFPMAKVSAVPSSYQSGLVTSSAASSQAPVRISSVFSLSQAQGGKETSMASSRNEHVSRPRMRFTQDEVEVLEGEFQRTPWPDGYVPYERRTELAVQLGVTKSRIDAWFNHRRTKEKYGPRSQSREMRESGALEEATSSSKPMTSEPVANGAMS
ncbi:CDX4 [Branchiostoma lanceolatum]|uniref:CDX4 protein n=1 Tax=Branchiostoma lanceolatum TaxID=7740 RepID=A0A8K0EX22_BRALA|nr:CDX4 [Branchiostoma lanceolatum]